MRVTRNPSLPKIRVPVLYVPAAMEEFERVLGQEPIYGEEVVEGYVSAEIFWRFETWQKLQALAGRGIVWLPAGSPGEVVVL